MFGFNEWLLYRKFDEGVLEQKTLYHGATTEDIESIYRLGILSQMEDRGINEFWATSDFNRAIIYAKVNSKVYDVYNPPPLAVLQFQIPIQLLKILKNQGSLETPESGLFQFMSESFDQLNEYITNKRIIQLEPAVAA